MRSCETSPSSMVDSILGLPECVNNRVGTTDLSLGLRPLLRWSHGLDRHCFTLHGAFHSDLLCGVLVQLGFVTFESVDALPDNEGILVPLLYAIAQSIRIGLVLHHVSLAAHRIAHHSG